MNTAIPLTNITREMFKDGVIMFQVSSNEVTSLERFYKCK